MIVTALVAARRPRDHGANGDEARCVEGAFDVALIDMMLDDVPRR